jgi:hypothetical protein
LVGSPEPPPVAVFESEPPCVFPGVGAVVGLGGVDVEAGVNEVNNVSDVVSYNVSALDAGPVPV